MQSLPLIPSRYCPSTDTLAVLNGRRWCCSYSGGKDSTAMATWIEWLRRVGLVKCDTPALVMSDTTVEYPFLRSIADRLMAQLTISGWTCQVVRPLIHERLYNRIFGIGNTPVHPGGRKRMRWCTRATKIDPMKRYARTVADDVLQLSGVRWGESDTRDGKLKASGCAAGGECGLPEPGEGVFGPIITWQTCKVVDWLSGKAGDEVGATIADLLPMMLDLVQVYGIKQNSPDMFGVPAKVDVLRFGCIGCPAITRERVIAGRDPKWSALRRLWGIWQELYLRKNRCCRIKSKSSGRDVTKTGPKPTWSEYHVGFGPVRMEARKHYFAELLEIQREAGVTLVTEEDIAFIHECWEKQVYPRGWSAADELTQPPDDTLFSEQEH